MKYTLELKLECVQRYKDGIHIDPPENCGTDRRHFMCEVRAWAKTCDVYGEDGLARRPQNRAWTREGRFSLVAEVLAGKSIKGVATGAGINPGQLYEWVRRYRERGVDGLECRKGRPRKMPKNEKRKSGETTPTEREELELLRKRNEYLEAENEYLKKLDALVTKREAERPKARKRKSSGR